MAGLSGPLLAHLALYDVPPTMVRWSSHTGAAPSRRPPRPRLAGDGGGAATAVSLQPRERQLLVAYVQTRSVKAAAFAVGCSERTAQRTLTELYRREALDGIAHAVWRYRRVLEEDVVA